MPLKPKKEFSSLLVIPSTGLSPPTSNVRIVIGLPHDHLTRFD